MTSRESPAGRSRPQLRNRNRTGSRSVLVIPARLKGKDLTEEQQASLAQGKATYIKDMTDNEGNLFSAFVRVNHERAKFDFFKWNPDKSKKQEQSQQAASVRTERSRQTPSAGTARYRKPIRKGYPSDHSHE